MKSIRMKYRGADYLIPANRAFEIGAEVEEIVTLGEIGSWGNRVPFFKVARCYGAMLRFAGAKAADDEVHAEIMANLASAGKARAEDGTTGAEIAAMAAVTALVTLLMGGAPQGDADTEAEPEKPTAS